MGLQDSYFHGSDDIDLDIKPPLYEARENTRIYHSWYEQGEINRHFTWYSNVGLLNFSGYNDEPLTDYSGIFSLEQARDKIRSLGWTIAYTEEPAPPYSAYSLWHEPASESDPDVLGDDGERGMLREDDGDAKVRQWYTQDNRVVMLWEPNRFQTVELLDIDWHYDIGEGTLQDARAYLINCGWKVDISGVSAGKIVGSGDLGVLVEVEDGTAIHYYLQDQALFSYDRDEEVLTEYTSSSRGERFSTLSDAREYLVEKGWRLQLLNVEYPNIPLSVLHGEETITVSISYTGTLTVIKSISKESLIATMLDNDMDRDEALDALVDSEIDTDDAYNHSSSSNWEFDEWVEE